MKPYPAYKPSGNLRPDEVPEHWETVQLGRIGVFSKGSGGTKDDEVPDGIPCVRFGDLYTTHEYFIDQTRSYVSPEKANAYTDINRGDALFPTSGETIEEIGKSAVNLMYGRVLCGGDLTIFHPKVPMEPGFLGYALGCSTAQLQKSRMGRGVTIMHIYGRQLKYLWLFLPPLSEQRAIARYLDYMDRRIQQYVKAKERLIELLEEQKRAVINQAVTRGLDPDVPLKPSGVEWLGDVPEHWEVRRLKTMCRMKSGDFIATESIESAGKYAVYGGNGVRGYTTKYNHDGEFVLVGRQGALCGNVHIASGKIWATEHAVVATLSPGHNVSWFGAVLDAMNLNQYSIAAAQPGLAVERIMNLHLPVPNRHEQKQIADALSDTLGGIERAVTQSRRQIELVKEYQTRLIADVVTGKSDVREAVANLPNETVGDEDMAGSGDQHDCEHVEVS